MTIIRVNIDHALSTRCPRPTASSGIYLPQNQWLFQTVFISSIGTFLVSGMKKNTNAVMSTTQPAKKKKSPNLRWHSMERKSWPMMKVKNIFTETLMDCPADLVSSGWISLGTSQPRGPHDHANAAT
ncbi:exodeoxyribonuclease 7 large subunit [Striga asiatica]|uniref:Exodeoxyribonuclease 7 large subunit n=1 Tax=Striga asiatica TaxID=4170 RepID=A0A5A7Q8L6_STRAF|nr:exodeoxyribonuclease 7 large subunit [Striga asiatica]